MDVAHGPTAICELNLLTYLLSRIDKGQRTVIAHILKTNEKLRNQARGYETFFMLNSAKHQIFSADPKVTVMRDDGADKKFGPVYIMIPNIN